MTASRWWLLSGPKEVWTTTKLRVWWRRGAAGVTRAEYPGVETAALAVAAWRELSRR